MSRRLPSLNALRAFEAAARHESFTKAAVDLHVTQGAVSHQVKALEGELGLKLFRREHQKLVLSDAGRRYLEAVRDAFDRISDATDRVVQQQNSGVLTVSVSPNFAAKWLVPRLGTFVATHPEIDLRISATLHHVDFAREDVDLAIRHGEGDWPGLHVTRLCSEQLFAVCSPALMRGRQALRKPADLRKHTLIHLDDRRDWQKWLDQAAVKGIDLSRGVVFNQASMAIDAAVDGQGVALSRTALVSWDLIQGRLVRPFADALGVSYAYYVVCPNASAEKPKITIFREWLKQQAENDGKRVAKLLDGRR